MVYFSQILLYFTDIVKVWFIRFLQKIIARMPYTLKLVPSATYIMRKKYRPYTRRESL